MSAPAAALEASTLVAHDAAVRRAFAPCRVTSRSAAVVVGAAWAEHEARNAHSRKGKPADGEFVWSFDEAAAFVDRSVFGWSDLALTVGDAANARWAELRAETDGALAWAAESEP